MPHFQNHKRCFINDFEALTYPNYLRDGTLESDSLSQLVANFADPEVGAVSGIYRVQHASEARLGSQEEICWRYETFSKIQESNLASVPGGHGQVLGVRKDLYPYPAPGTINDDYVIPDRVLAGGSRVI